MYYVCTIADNYPNLCWLQYDWDKNPDHLQFLDSKKIKITKPILLYLDNKANKNTFLKFDYVMSDAVPLVSQKLSEIITKYAATDVQLIKTKVFQGNDFVGDYFIPLILRVVNCIDKKKSVFDKEIEDFTKISFKPGSLGSSEIAKAKGFEDNNLIVQEKFVEACKKEKIKGIDFFKEPFINPLYS